MPRPGTTAIPWLVKFFALLLLTLAFIVDTNAAEVPAHKLSDSKPAATWDEAFQLSNGTLGAVVFGGIGQERIPFGNFSNAQATQLTASAAWGELRLEFKGHNEHASDYERELNKNPALAVTSYRVDEVSYRREAFISVPAKAFVMRIIADHRGWLNFRLSLPSQQTNAQVQTSSDLSLTLTGTTSDKLRFDARVRVIATGGTLKAVGDSLEVENADSALIFLTASSGSRKLLDRPTRLAKRSTAALNQVARKNFETLLPTPPGK